MAAQQLSLDPDAVRWSAAERDRVGRPLLVLMHGYGSNEDDLFGLSPFLPLEPVIASVRAPIEEAGGYAWFSRSVYVDGTPTLENADTAAVAVLDWLGGLAVEPTSVGLLGFSQGGAMVLQLLRRAAERFDYGVQLSGYVVAGEDAADAGLRGSRPPVFWGRGTEDDVIGADSIARTSEWLPKHSRLDSRIYEGVAHSVSRTELSDVAAFISAQLRP